MGSKTGLTLLLLQLTFFIVADNAYSQEKEWGVFSTRFCTVFYEEGVDLNSVSRRVNLGFSDFYNPRGFRSEDTMAADEVLSEKLDAIFTKVQDVLDMRPSEVHVAINIYKTRDGLDAAYEEIFNEPNEAASFYIYKTNTIYTTEKTLNEKIFAHEMAHCIIDHYFVILPPRKIQEMLAVYADVHLKD